MSAVFVAVLIAVSLGVFAVVLQRRRSSIYELPFLMTMSFVTFVIPQLIGLSRNVQFDQVAVSKASLMSIFCLCSGLWGYRAGRSEIKVASHWEFDRTRLAIGGAVLIACGAVFFFAISSLPSDEVEASNWSGTPVLYLFFATMLSYGLALTFSECVASPTFWRMLPAVAGMLFYATRIIVQGRRGVALEFACIVMFSLWFRRGLCVPRAMAMGAMVFAMIFIHNAGAYRSIMLDPVGSRVTELSETSFVANLVEVFQDGGVELRNAALMIEAKDETWEFDFGLFHWNALVSNYVPGQLVGQRVKEALLFDLPDDAYRRYGYVPDLGSTSTGMVDAFNSFWYLGSFKFFLIGFVMRRLYDGALRGALLSQIMYTVLMPSALQAITHHTQWFWSHWVHMALFLVPVMLVARVRGQGLRATSSTVPVSVPR